MMSMLSSASSGRADYFRTRMDGKTLATDRKSAGVALKRSGINLEKIGADLKQIGMG
jgi:hypothetical protein